MHAGLRPSIHGESHRTASGEDISNRCGQIVLYVPDTRLLRLALSLRHFRAAMVGPAAATGRGVAPDLTLPASPGLAVS